MYPSPLRSVTIPVAEPLMVYRFLMAESEDTRSLVIARDDGGSQVVANQRWEQNPADMITNLLLRDLESSGLFAKAVDQFSSALYRYALEGTIHRLRGVIRDGKALGVVDVTVSLIDFESPIGSEKAVLKKRYKIETPCKDSTADEIFQGLNRGVRDLSARVRRDIRSALQPQKPKPPKNPAKRLQACLNPRSTYPT